MSSIAPDNHTRRKGQTTDSWITPKWLVDRLGEFDLDPCASTPQPWLTAARCYTEKDDGLSQPWNGFVYCNPPYGRSTGNWLRKMAMHNKGIALIFARTETVMFFEHVWSKASCLLFIYGRLTFYRPDGTCPPFNSGAPSVLVGYGQRSISRLSQLTDIGRFVMI